MINIKKHFVFYIAAFLLPVILFFSCSLASSPPEQGFPSEIRGAWEYDKNSPQDRAVMPMAAQEPEKLP